MRIIRVLSFCLCSLCGIGTIAASPATKENSKKFDQVFKTAFRPQILASDDTTRLEFTALIRVSQDMFPANYAGAAFAYSICKTLYQNAAYIQRIANTNILNNVHRVSSVLSNLYLIGDYALTLNEPRQFIDGLFGTDEGRIVWQIISRQEYRGMAMRLRQPSANFAGNEMSAPPSVSEPPLNPPTAMPNPSNSSAPAQAEPSEYK